MRIEKNILFRGIAKHTALHWTIISKSIAIVMLCVLASPALLSAAETKKDIVEVACVGDSITYGYKVENRETNNYPKQLSLLLGKDWNVTNYGVSRMTMLRAAKNDYSYWKTKEYKQVLAAKPDVILIMLGTNDMWQRNWSDEASQKEFKKDYSEMIDTFAKLESKPRIWVCLPPPVMPVGPDNNKNINAVIELTKSVATVKKIPIIDMNAWMNGKNDMFVDKLHPNAAGAKEMAKKTATVLLSKQ